VPFSLRSSARKWLWLEGLAWVVAICYGGAYLYVAFKRITYPYDLDFIEDNMLMQAMQVSLGKPVYVAPNADFVPQVYMPLYTLLGGSFFKFMTPSYLPLRLLSFSATMITAFLILWISRRICGDAGIGVCAAALFLAGYRTTGGWYELARVDALYVMLTLAGAALLAHGKEKRFRLPMAGCILALAFLTKQNGLFFGLIVIVYLFLTARWQTLGFAVPFALVSLLPVLYWDQISGGWFSTYAFKIAYLSPIDFHRVVTTLRADLFGSMAGLTLAFIIAMISLIWHERGKRALLEPWSWFIVAALLISIAGRASVGGNRNNLMPAYAFLCLAPGLAARGTSLWGQGWRAPARGGLFVLIIAQFVLTSLSPKYPSRFIPTSSMKSAGDRLVQHIASVQGPVLVLMHPYYAWLAGKEPAVDIQMLWHARLRGAEPLPEDFVARIREHYYSEIISDESNPFESEAEFAALLKSYYSPARQIPPGESPWTITGVIVHPQKIYLPR
jgi:4-amino-4-deoxy-L-arabinose transferase-like glycosyltransferase